MLAAVVDGTGRVLDTEATATPGPGSGARRRHRRGGRGRAGRRGRATASPCTAGCPVGVAAAGFVDQGRRAGAVRTAPAVARRAAVRTARPSASAAGSRATSWSTTTPPPHSGPRAASAPRRRRVDAVMITLGTGIGGALMVPRHAAAGQQRDGRRVRPHAGGARRAPVRVRSAGAAGSSTAPAVRWPGPPRRAGPTSPARRSRPPPARETWSPPRRTTEVAHWLGVGVANLVAAFDPQLVVVGGGVSAAGDLLLEPARVAMATSLVGAGHPRPARSWSGAELGPLAGVVGVADLARTAGRIRRVGRWGRAPSRVARGRARRR